MSAQPQQPVFYYDLASPGCYLVAEQITSSLPVAPEWEPVHAIEPGVESDDVDRELIECRAAALGIQPLRWPTEWPPDSSFAMLAATYAKRIGRAVSFSLAAFRQAFAGGRDLSDRDTVLIAAAACEMHPAALLKGVTLRSASEALERAAERARTAGVTALPSIQVGDRVFAGEESINRASRALEDRG